MEYKIRHNHEENRFEAVSNLEIIGVVNYYKEDNNIIVTHTGVESKYEGKGIAAALTKEVLTYISKSNLKITPLCSYTRSYVDRHPEYENLTNKENE